MTRNPFRRILAARRFCQENGMPHRDEPGDRMASIGTFAIDSVLNDALLECFRLLQGWFLRRKPEAREERDAAAFPNRARESDRPAPGAFVAGKLEARRESVP
jgi:hypothetical protein